MDWYIIEYLYPNSLDKFSKVMFPNVGVPCLSVLSYYDIKKLYSFFDKFGIYLTIEMYTKNMWGYTISLSDGRIFCPTQEPKVNRESTEIDGFYECFKQLEKNLELIQY